MFAKNEERSSKNKPNCDNIPFLKCQAGACCTKCKKPLGRGHAAHIYGWSTESARHAPNLIRNFFTNHKYFLYLCSECHDEIDQSPKIWTVRKCMELKAKHLKWVENYLPIKRMKRQREKEIGESKLTDLIHSVWRGEYENFEISHEDQDLELYIDTAASRKVKTRILAVGCRTSGINEHHQFAKPGEKVWGYNVSYIVLVSPYGATWKIFPRYFWNQIEDWDYPDHFYKPTDINRDKYARKILLNKDHIEQHIEILREPQWDEISMYFEEDDRWSKP